MCSRQERARAQSGSLLTDVTVVSLFPLLCTSLPLNDILPCSRQERARAQLGALLAEEYWALGSTSAARKLLLQVAHTYRRWGEGRGPEKVSRKKEK